MPPHVQPLDAPSQDPHYGLTLPGLACPSPLFRHLDPPVNVNIFQQHELLVEHLEMIEFDASAEWIVVHADEMRQVGADEYTSGVTST